MTKEEIKQQIKYHDERMFDIGVSTDGAFTEQESKEYCFHRDEKERLKNLLKELENDNKRD